MKCWGTNFAGQLGDGTRLNRNLPVDVVGLSSGATAIASGQEHTCAVVAGGVMCWGANFSGQLGDGTDRGSATPVAVVGLRGPVTALAAGGAFTCALSAAGGVRCWGTNVGGQLGDGTTVNRSTPVEVTGLGSGVTAIAAGDAHACALREGGAVVCWGTNFAGQLGDGTRVNRSAPVNAMGLSRGATAIATGAEHSCAVIDGTARCWGGNYWGQLGDGTDLLRETPVRVVGTGGRVIAVAAGGSHTCALSESGGVACWGTNFAGQLGDGTTVNRHSPTSVSGLSSGAIMIAAGAAHSCALTADGALRCWGTNFSGQLGDGTNVARSVPVEVTALPSPRPIVRWRLL